MTPDRFSIHNKIGGSASDGHVFLTLHDHQNAILDPTEARWLGDVMHQFADLLEGKDEQAQPLEQAQADAVALFDWVEHVNLRLSAIEDCCGEGLLGRVDGYRVATGYAPDSEKGPTDDE